MQNTAPEVLRILVVEPDSGVRLGLSLRLDAERDLEVAGVATSDQEAIQLFRGSHPDVILLGGRPERDGSVARLRAALPDVPLVALSLADAASSRAATLAAGAMSFVSKHDGDRELLDVLRRTVRLHRLTGGGERRGP